MGKRAERPLTSLTPRDVEAFVTLRSKERLAARTIVLDVKVIRTALNAARRQGIIPTNPAEAVELPSIEGTGCERGTFTPAEVNMLVTAAEAEWKTLIMLAYFTGARLSDCCRMEWAHVELARETLTFTQGKTGARITVPLHPDLLRHLNELANTDRPERFVSPGMANLKPGGRHGLSEGFKRIMVRAGLDMQKVQSDTARQLSRRTFHALRHSFASALANAGVPPEIRMKLTGHKSEAIHRGYSHHELETLATAVAKMPGLHSV